MKIALFQLAKITTERFGNDGSLVILAFDEKENPHHNGNRLVVLSTVEKTEGLNPGDLFELRKAEA